MKFTLMGPGPHVDLAITDTTAVVGGAVTIHCADRQRDHQVVVDVRATNGVLAEGAGNAFVASFVIPPRVYVESEAPDQTDMNGQPTVVRTPVPLSGDAVEVRLWTHQTNRSPA